MNALEKALHGRALEVASRYRRCEGELLEILQRIDEKKVFGTLGYPSLFQYAVKELKLAESVAYSFINVARKAREIPEIKSEISNGNLTVSKAIRIVSIIRPANASEWLEKAKTLSKEKLEKAIATVAPQVLTPEKAKYVTEKRLHIQFGVDEELYEKLKRVKDVLSQKLRRAATLEDAISAMAALYIEKYDPLEKARRAEKKASYLSQLEGSVFENRETELCPGRERDESFLDEKRSKNRLHLN